jgi:hypothetical protein
MKRAVLLVPAILLGFVSSSDAQVNLSSREKFASAAIKGHLDKLRGEIKAKKKKFTVGYTTAMDFKLSELARTNPPADLPKVASEQNAKALPIVTKFFNKTKPQGGGAAAACDPKAKSFDWRDKGKLTPVRQQGNCGSCWSFTGTAAFEGSYSIVNGKSIDGSEQEVLDCAKNKSGTDAGSCGGGWYAGVFDHFIANGARDESSVPYKGKEQSCGGGAGSFHAEAWGYVKNDGSIPSQPEMNGATAGTCGLPTASRASALRADEVVDGAPVDAERAAWGPVASATLAAPKSGRTLGGPGLALLQVHRPHDARVIEERDDAVQHADDGEHPVPRSARVEAARRRGRTCRRSPPSAGGP